VSDAVPAHRISPRRSVNISDVFATISWTEPLDGATLLDLGTGDGLIGLAALDRVGPGGSVIFCDISHALLDQCREAVHDHSLTGRAQFVNTHAENLTGIADNSVDVVTTRAVLIFVTDKPAAFAAIHRVLRPGGRMTLREPVGSLMFPEPDDRFWGYAIAPETALATRVKAAVADLEDPIYRDAMMNFNDRDLVQLAQTAGFDEVQVECHIDIGPGSVLRPIDLQELLDTAPNPTAPTIRQGIDAALTTAERERFLARLQQAVDDRDAVHRTAVAHCSQPRAVSRRPRPLRTTAHASRRPSERRSLHMHRRDTARCQGRPAFRRRARSICWSGRWPAALASVR
jgi:ubiquinone/menaquinone biosynthesis C-methylase UbiE